MTTTEAVIQALVSSLKEAQQEQSSKGKAEAIHHLTEAVEWLEKDGKKS